MDPFSKKRKLDENSKTTTSPAIRATTLRLTRNDILHLLRMLSHDQLADIATVMALTSEVVLDSIRAAANRDPALHNIFMQGLGCEVVVITNKYTARSKGYGFITFRHADYAVHTLKEPSKKIDGRLIVTQLTAVGMVSGLSGGGASTADMPLRKIFVGNIPTDMPSKRLLAQFYSQVMCIMGTRTMRAFT